jgi:hypothetical protein
MEREERRKIRQERRERKRQREAESARRHMASEQDGGPDTATAMSSARGEGAFGFLTRRITTRATQRPQQPGEEIEMQAISSNERQDDAQPAEAQGRRRRNPDLRVHRERTFITESTSSDASPLPLESVSGVLSYPINAILRYVRYLRSGHEQATKAKVEKRAHLRRKVFEGESRRISANEPAEDADRGADDPTPRNGLALPDSTENVGWGLGSFGIREAAEGERRLTQAQLLMNRERMLQQGAVTDDTDSADDGKNPETDAEDLGFSDVDVERGEGPSNHVDPPTPRPRSAPRSRSRSPTDRGAGQHVTVQESMSPRRDESHARVQDEPVAPPSDQGASWYWWKPLRKWRRTDKSVY